MPLSYLQKKSIICIIDNSEIIMIDRQEINTTFERIEKSLDLRFQKKGTLFISKDNLEIAKESLFKGNYQNYFALESKVGMPVLIQVILKHPWIINDMTLCNKDFKKELARSLSGNSAKQYVPLMRKIAKDEVFSTIIFKEFIEEKYYQQINVSDCREIYEDQTKKPKIRALCFGKSMKESDESGLEKIKHINEMFMFDYELYKTVKDRDYLNVIMNEISNKDEVAEWILENKCQYKMDKIWSSAFILLKEEAFSVSVQYISNNMDYDDFTTKWLMRKVISKLFSYAKDNDELMDIYIESLVDLYRARDAYRIKVLFLDMLESSKFKNKELAFKLLDQYEQIGISERFEDRVDNIREWKDGSNGYNSGEEAFFDISNNQDLLRKSALNYVSIQFKKTDFSIIKDLYDNYSYNSDIVKAISYFISQEMERDGTKLLERLGDLSAEYAEQIVNYIDEYTINTATTRSFLHDVDRDDILKKFVRR